MATTTSTKTGIPSFDTAFEQVRESSEQVLAAARKAGNLYLDSYEKAVDRTTELAQAIGSREAIADDTADDAESNRVPSTTSRDLTYADPAVARAHAEHRCDLRDGSDANHGR